MGLRPRSKGGALAACALVLVVAPSAARAQTPPDPDWVKATLDFQYELGSDVGMVNAPWVGTHNSFNSAAEMGLALSVLDSNQRINLVRQLDAGVRSLELDLHKFLTLNDGIGFRPVVCHARPASEGHLGCSIEKPLRPVLREIAGWLRAPEHADQVLLLYLEDHLQDAEGYAAGAQVVRDVLGEMVYLPPAEGCAELPADLTRDAIRAAGKQVVIVSDCGTGAEWPSVAFSWEDHVEERPRGYRDYPDCGPDFERETYDTKLVRYFEDSTQLTRLAGTPDDGITPATAAAMTRCGVDLVGLDQLAGPGDPRLEALAWSWAPDRPRPREEGKRRNCAIQSLPRRAGGRASWFDRRCRQRHRPACATEDGRWRISARRLRWPRAVRRCERRGLALGVPRTGFEAQELAAKMRRREARVVWLGTKRRHGGRWRQADPR